MDIRTIYYSPEYEEFLSVQSQSVQTKYDYIEHIICSIKVVNTKFVKRLEGTEFYEARVSVGSNEYRTVIFAIDAENFIESSRVLFLNSFVKKSTKQYKQAISDARRILNRYKEDTKHD